jgi:hypothetical protein
MSATPRPMVTLQINLAPTDLPTATHVLPHQLRQWGGQVDEVLLTIDLHRSRGRFSEAWHERLPGIRRLTQDLCTQYRHARALEVDYRPASAAAIAAAFFRGGSVPAKDWRGGPFYSYFFGLYIASSDYVLHMDCDMMYGGGSQTWVAEAINLMQARPEVVACNPLPGPPTADGALRSQRLDRYAHSSLAFTSPALSTRHFILDRHRLMQRAARLRTSRPRQQDVIKALVDGNPAYNPPEVILTEAMAAHGLIRVDFLGSPPGMWGVHPLYRTPGFFERLPWLVRAIENGDVPEAQRGCHDLNESMVEWTGVEKSWGQKIGTHVRLAATRLRPRPDHLRISQ